MGRQKRENTIYSKNYVAKQTIIYLGDNEEPFQAKEMGKCWWKSEK